MTALAVPSVPRLDAGHVVQQSELTQLCSAASFLLAPPMTKVLDETGGAAIATTASLVNFTNALYDVDGAWAAGNPGRLTIQTPGWYKVRYAVNCLPAGSNQAPFVTHMTSTTGSNNPAGSGVVSSHYWGGYADGFSGAHCYPGAAGLWPAYLYSGDYLQLYVSAQTTGASTSNAGATGGTLNGSYLSIEYVSTT